MAYDTFTDWLNEEMTQRGWSQAELARRMGKTRASVNKIVLGDRGIGPEMCNELARAFNMPPVVVMRKAGLLPPDPTINPNREEANYHMERLSPEGQRNVIRYIQLQVEIEEGGVSGKTKPAKN